MRGHVTHSLRVKLKTYFFTFQKELLEQVINKASGRQKAVFASVKDHFELCLAKCRTDSHSVQHENKYRDPKSKHCFGLTEAHESQREVIESNDLV